MTEILPWVIGGSALVCVAAVWFRSQMAAVEMSPSRRVSVFGAMALWALAGACFTDPSLPQPEAVTLYSKKAGVHVQGDSRVLGYGEEVRCSVSDDSTCFLGGHGTVTKGDLSTEPPPKSGQFVHGRADVDPTKPQQFIAFEPATRLVLLGDGKTWIQMESIRDHAETEQERAAIKLAAEQERKERSQREREQAKMLREEAARNRQAAKVAAVEAVSDRRTFARQLRDNYLSMGQDIKVSVSGSRATTLKLEYPLINDVWLYQFQHNDEVMSSLRSKGFEYLVLSDGWNYGMRLTL